MKFESILEEIDGFGPFQIIILVLLCCPRIVLPAHFLLNNFIAAVQSHRCDFSGLEDGGVLGNFSLEQKETINIPAGDQGELQSCHMFAQPQFQLLNNGSNDGNLSTVPCQSGWVYDNSTFSSTITSEWDLVCDKKSLTKMTNTIFFLGVMVGAVFFGFVSDKYGRKKSLLASYIVALVFSFSSALSNSFILFAVLRFFTGFGLMGISIISIVISVEWVNTDRRSFIGIAGSLAWSVGNLLLGGCAYLVRDWRSLTMVVSSPLIFAVLTWWWIPESARWLLAHGKSEQAQFYLDRCAKINKRGKLSSKIKPDVLSSPEDEDKPDRNYTYLDLVKTPKMRRLTIITGIVWYGVASTYYGISLNITGFGLNLYLTHFIYAAIEVPSKLTTYCCLNILGRRKCQAGTLLLTGTCITINIFVPKELWYVRASVAILGKFFSEASFTTLFLYTTEIFPTVLRQNSLGYNNFTSRLGASLAPLILLLEDVWTFLPAVIFSSMSIIAGLSALLLPETLNVRLPETIEDIENPKNSQKSGDMLLEPKSTAEV